jgi:hypothetical protein
MLRERMKAGLEQPVGKEESAGHCPKLPAQQQAEIRTIVLQEALRWQAISQAGLEVNLRTVGELDTNQCWG